MLRFLDVTSVNWPLQTGHFVCFWIRGSVPLPNERCTENRKCGHKSWDGSALQVDNTLLRRAFKQIVQVSNSSDLTSFLGMNLTYQELNIYKGKITSVLLTSPNQTPKTDGFVGPELRKRYLGHKCPLKPVILKFDIMLPYYIHITRIVWRKV